MDAFLSGLIRDRIAYVNIPATSSRGASPDYHLVRTASWDPGVHRLGPYRPVEPLKAVVFPPRLNFGPLDEPVAADLPERIVIGAKNCDLSALRVHDWVFLGNEPEDPFYAEARRKTILVACDCTEARDVCFCTAVGEQPYARKGFDINLAPVGQGYLVEAGSEAGTRLLEEQSAHLRPADQAAVEERDRNRERMTARVRDLAESAGLPGAPDLRRAVCASVESPLWDDFAKDCVECGACNFACCTCHCFLLADGRDAAGRPARARLWDSCLYRDFARVAGGANPRGHRAERLFNRFDKKFNYFPEVCGFYACDGCGRCAEACTGNIDIRNVLKRAIHEQPPVHAGAGHG